MAARTATADQPAGRLFGPSLARRCVNIEAGAAEHLAFQHLQPVDVAFNGA